MGENSAFLCGGGSLKIVFVHIVIDVTATDSHAICFPCGSCQESILMTFLEPSDLYSNMAYAQNCPYSQPDVSTIRTSNRMGRHVLASALKNRSKTIPIWVGGGHIIANPSSFLESEFDAVCYGEGEDILPQALSHARAGKTFTHPSWIMRRTIGMPTAAIVENLNSMPLPNIEIFETNDVLNYPV